MIFEDFSRINTKKLLNLFISATIIFVSLLVLSSCGSKYRSAEGMVWHTTYHITYNSADDLTDSIAATLREVGASLNAFDPASLVSRINTNSSDTADSHFVAVFNTASKLNALSGGEFDPTTGPLITAWGFGKGHQATADTLRIDTLLKDVGISKVHIDGYKVIKERPYIEFNFSAIAKGYGCDQVAAMMQRNGVNDYLIEIGGEIAAGGKSPSGGKWRVSVDKPTKSADDLSHVSQTIVEITNMGMATSGNYRNYQEKNGERYGHTISPITGRPAQTDVLSATVITETAMEADAYATTLMVVGSKKGAELAVDQNLAALMIMSDGSVWSSPKFKALESSK